MLNASNWSAPRPSLFTGQIVRKFTNLARACTLVPPGGAGEAVRLLEVSFVIEVDRPVWPALAVGEAETLVQRPGGHVALAGAQIHVVGAQLPGLVERGLHQPAAQSLSPPGWNDVQLRQVALEARTPESGAETEHRQAVRAGAAEQDHSLVRAQQPPDSLSQHHGTGRGVVVLLVEVVQQLPDGAHVRHARAPDGQVAHWPALRTASSQAAM